MSRILTIILGLLALAAPWAGPAAALAQEAPAPPLPLAAPLGIDDMPPLPVPLDPLDPHELRPISPVDPGGLVADTGVACDMG